MIWKAQGGSPWGTFRWDPATGHTTTLAAKGMPAPGRLTFVLPGGFAPAINNSDEVALIGWLTALRTAGAAPAIQVGAREPAATGG